MLMSAPPYRILSLDGGGSWALLQAQCLQRLFGIDCKGHEVLAHFDLVAANSGGSIVLAGLVANLRLSEILMLFLNSQTRQQLFSPTADWWWPLFNQVYGFFSPGKHIGPQYSTVQKLVGLEAALPEIINLELEQVPTYARRHDGTPGPHILISSFDYNTQRSNFFRSDPASAGSSTGLNARLQGLPLPTTTIQGTVRLLAAVHSASTAPIKFFDRTAQVAVAGQINYLWDGGVAGYNNPVLAAVTEAIANGTLPSQISVLSIGTGITVPAILAENEVCYPPCLAIRPVASSGFFDDVSKVASAIVGAPPDAASYVAFSTLNPGFARKDFTNLNFIRANPCLRPIWNEKISCWQKPERLTNFTDLELQRLVKLNLDAVKQSDVNLIARLGQAWMNDSLPNQPIRNGHRMSCLLGQATFGQVQSLFQQVFPSTQGQC